MLISIRPEYAQPDIAVVDDVLVHDCYRVEDLPSPIETAMDVGAHIGSFTARLLMRFPNCHAICVEANPANERALVRTLSGTSAKAEMSACYYANEPVELFSTIRPGSRNTGGSFVQSRGSRHADSLLNRDEYDRRGLVSTATVEGIMAAYGFERLDLLKLDCEGSENNILRHAPLERIGCIVGEWHCAAEFPRIVAERFSDWTLDILRDGTPGLFRLSRRDWWNMR